MTAFQMLGLEAPSHRFHFNVSLLFDVDCIAEVEATKGE